MNTAPTYFQLRVEGHLDLRWCDRFVGFSIVHLETGDSLLTGPVEDQSALLGLFRQLGDLGMTLVSASRIETQPPLAPPVLESNRSGKRASLWTPAKPSMDV